MNVATRSCAAGVRLEFDVRGGPLSFYRRTFGLARSRGPGARLDGLAVALTDGVRHAGRRDGVRATGRCPGVADTAMARDLPDPASLAGLCVNCRIGEAF